jgi:hypothetical protein
MRRTLNEHVCIKFKLPVCAPRLVSWIACENALLRINEPTASYRWTWLSLSNNWFRVETSGQLLIDLQECKEYSFNLHNIPWICRMFLQFAELSWHEQLKRMRRTLNERACVKFKPPVCAPPLVSWIACKSALLRINDPTASYRWAWLSLSINRFRVETSGQLLINLQECTEYSFNLQNILLVCRMFLWFAELLWHKQLGRMRRTLNEQACVKFKLLVHAPWLNCL